MHIFKKKEIYPKNIEIAAEQDTFNQLEKADAPIKPSFTAKNNNAIAVLVTLMLVGVMAMIVPFLKSSEEYSYVEHTVTEEKPTYLGIADYYFVNGLALVTDKEQKKFGYIDENYDLVIPLVYETAFHFQGDRAMVTKNDRVGFINRRNKAEIPIKYIAIRAFKEGFYAAYLEKQGWGFLNWSGKAVIPHQYRDANSFYEGMAAVQDFRKYWGFINTKGEEITEFKFDEVQYFSGGLAAVQIKDKWGFIDKQGKWVIYPKFEKVFDYDFSKENGYAKVYNNERIYFVNRKGVEVKP